MKEYLLTKSGNRKQKDANAKHLRVKNVVKAKEISEAKFC